MTEPITLPRSLVVGVDYGSTGEGALDYAIELAAKHEAAKVHVVSVCLGSRPRVRLSTPEETRTVTVDEATAHLAKYVERRIDVFRANGGTIDTKQVVLHLRVGAPAEELCKVGAETDADLILVGTHGRKGVTRLLLGSVAEEVASKAGSPVFVVKE